MNDIEKETKEINLIKKNLFDRIKVCIEWDGYCNEENLNECYNVASQFNHLYTYNDTKESLSDTYFKKAGEYQRIVQGLKNLEKVIHDEAQDIFNHAYKINQDVEKISSKYYDRFIENFINNNKDKLVLIAPKPWYPLF